MLARLLSWSFRVGVSLIFAALPAYAFLTLLRTGGAAAELDLIGPAIDTLISTHLPWLTTMSQWLKQQAPLLAFWAVGALTVFRVWSKRIEFFAASGQDYGAMWPRSSALRQLKARSQTGS
jgi:hypothetical protein